MPAGQVNGADLAWMMTSTALVLLMIPALGFFYGGMVGNKNVLNTILMSFTTLGYSLVAWALVGYSLAFSPGAPVAAHCESRVSRPAPPGTAVTARAVQAAGACLSDRTASSVSLLRIAFGIIFRVNIRLDDAGCVS